jgi:uroporphyrinogen decarboxylase
MTSKERVLLAVAHKETDRAAADYGAHQEVTDRLMTHLGLHSREELLQYLGVDLRGVGFSYDQPNRRDGEGERMTVWGVRYQPGEEATPAQYIEPFHEDTTPDDVYAHPWPSPEALDYSGIPAQFSGYADDYAFVGGTWSPFFHEVGWLIGQERFFIWMSTKPEVIDAIIDNMVSYEVEVTRRFLEGCADKLDVVSVGNDFGSQRALVISPQMWLRFMRRPLKRFFDLAHDFGCKTLLHSCGSVRDIIPYLIEDGLDVLDPIQVRAAGMDLPGLVRDFGNRLCFHGGVDTQCTLPFGSPEEVRQQVRSYRELTRKGGGYIMTGSQELIEDIPTENILAMYEENRRG